MAVLRGASLLLTATLLSACPRAGTGEAQPPPPRGASMEEYLRDQEPDPPARPADTVEADAMRLHLIDVGQGTAALLEFPCGAVLVDTGGEKNEQFDGVAALTAYLDAFFERRRDLGRTLSLLVVSHPHIDHTRGLETVLSRYRVKNVVDNGDVREDIGGLPQLAMHDWLSRQKGVGHIDVSRSDIDPRDGLGGPVVDPVQGCAASAVDPIIRALWSGDLGREEIGHNPNDDSVVLRVDFGQASMLLPGDLELLSIARLVKKYQDAPGMLDADVFLVPHHGSKKSSTQDLVRRVSPRVAVISAGPYERHLKTEEEYTARVFGHPSDVTIGHLTHASHGVSGRRSPAIEVWVGKRGAWKGTPSEFARQTIDRAIYSTGWDGTIVITANANGWMEVTTERAAAPVTSQAAPR